MTRNIKGLKTEAFKRIFEQIKDNLCVKLKKAESTKGIYSWASLELVIDPEQSLELIHRIRQYNDLYKVGKLNYHPASNKVDWRKFTEDVIALLEKYNRKYYIKESLKKHLIETA